MIEMVYSIERRCFVLDKGTYNGFKYVIVSYGTHPCCYIFIPKGHRLYGKSYEDIDVTCHGGLTFSQDDLCFNPLPNDEWVIGWDYAHYDDYMGYYDMEIMKKYDHSNNKKWTTKELLEDVKKVIGQL